MVKTSCNYYYYYYYYFCDLLLEVKTTGSALPSPCQAWPMLGQGAVARGTTRAWTWLGPGTASPDVTFACHFSVYF